MEKNLFQVVDTFSGSKHIQFFATKEDAKNFRNEQNKKYGEEKSMKEVPLRFLVGRGKDHWKGSSFPERVKETKK